MSRVLAAASLLGLTTAVLLAGCTSGGNSAAPSTSASPSGTASGSGSATATPTVTAAALPESCQGMLPLLDLDQALGVPLVGQTLYIKGVPEPKIKRTGRVTCRLGVVKVAGGKSGPPRLEVGVSSYTDEAAATDRVQSTVTGLRGQGARPTDVQVRGLKATVLAGAGTSGTLVIATGARTVVISLADRVVHGGTTVKALTAVAELALKNLPQ
jgi:hypothetical protein